MANAFEQYKEKGLSTECERKINMIVGCIIASYLENETKKELVNFMRDLDEYLESEEF